MKTFLILVVATLASIQGFSVAFDRVAEASNARNIALASIDE